jgi:two-component system sensor kinase FixL
VAKRRPSPDDEAAPHDAETERLKAEIARLEAELGRTRESERMYRSSAELSARLAWRADPDGQMTVMSPIYSTVTGLPLERALGDGWLEVVPEGEAREALRRKWLDAVRDGTPFSEEFPVRLTTDAVHFARSEALPARDESGRITAWFGTTQNITHAKQAEEARRDAEKRLRESEELHRLTLELSQQIAWSVEKDGSGLTMSARYEELTGSTDFAQAQDSVHPDDRDLVQTRFTHAIATGTPLNVECRLRMKDGNYRRFRVRATPLRDDDGEILRWYGVTEDIHDYREADFARRDVEERYRLAGQATRDAIWDHDFTAGTIEWSENAAAVFGAGHRPLGCRPDSWWHERVHPEDRPLLLQSLKAAIEGDAKRWTGTYRFRKDDGAYADMVDRGFIIRDEEGRAIRAVGAMTDLTEQHRAEAEIRRMQGELVHVSRLSAMGAMASTLAHELNQPLTALANYISGAKRIVEQRGIGDAHLADALISAEIGALRAGEIVRRLRELVSRGAVSVRVEHLPQLIEDAGVLAFVDEHLRGVRHRIALDPAALYVHADRVQIQQVLINLIRNAVEALEGRELREVIISTQIVAGAMVEICVEDTGAGIDPADLDSLFSEFMTTKSGGMGIGLPISRTIVEAHGGKIWVGNRPEGGAMFRFTLPRAKDEWDKSRPF